jgi:hypothetical protein
MTERNPKIRHMEAVVDFTTLRERRGRHSGVVPAPATVAVRA